MLRHKNTPRSGAEGSERLCCAIRVAQLLLSRTQKYPCHERAGGYKRGTNKEQRDSSQNTKMPPYKDVITGGAQKYRSTLQRFRSRGIGPKLGGVILLKLYTLCGLSSNAATGLEMRPWRVTGVEQTRVS